MRTMLRGGRVVDPGSGVDADLDVVIEEATLAALAAPGALAEEPGDRVVDLAGALVVPGLIDLHAHWYEGSPYGVEPRANLRGGVTCSVDAGTAGFESFRAFRRFAIDPAPVRIFAFVHVSAAGLAASMVGELEEIRYARPAETAEIIRANRDVAVGVKVRIGTQAAGRNVRGALLAALEAASLADVPVMVHIADGADVPWVASQLRAGDIVTHMLTANGMGIVGEDGRVRPEVRAARARGVLFDVGHGCGSFSFEVARRALADGFAPDTISTDLHRYSIPGPVIDLPTTMAKLTHLGMSRDEVLRSVTATPAAAIGHPELGALRVGGPADITVLRMGPGAEMIDSTGRREVVEATWVPERVFVAGEESIPSEVDVELRPYTAADLLVDCTAPLR